MIEAACTVRFARFPIHPIDTAHHRRTPPSCPSPLASARSCRIPLLHPPSSFRTLLLHPRSYYGITTSQATSFVPALNVRRQIYTRLPRAAAFHAPVVCPPPNPALVAVFRHHPHNTPQTPATCPNRPSRSLSAAADLSATLLTSSPRQKAPTPPHHRPSESSKGRTRPASIPWMAPKGN